MKKWEVWFRAYSKNYGGTGLMNSEVVAEQAWQAAETVAAERVVAAEYLIESTSQSLHVLPRAPSPTSRTGAISEPALLL